MDRAAREMMARHGVAARQYLEERAARLEKDGDWVGHATTLRVLSALERLLATADEPSAPAA